MPPASDPQILLEGWMLDMILRLQTLFPRPLSSNLLMAFKDLPKPPPLTALQCPTPFTSSRLSLFHTDKLPFSSSLSIRVSSKPSTSRLSSHGLCSLSHAHAFPPVTSERSEVDPLSLARLEILNKKMEEIGIDTSECKFGENRQICPKCKGGDSGEMSFSLIIANDGNSAAWNCFRAKCGWRGGMQALAGPTSSYQNMKKVSKVEKAKEISVESLSLEPLCDEIIAYFAERMISVETLQRNFVMQQRANNQISIAFTYRRNGVLVSCKYRDVDKRFWQEKDTEKIFYGLDDIRTAKEIIIVEGEIDKLAMEEAGYRNCVSVPQGAPPSVSSEDLPDKDKDTSYKYLWNCKDYFEKATRIILATDSDSPGQALAEELARRLGKERCWRVRWPKKNDFEYFKDADEVLMYLGASELKKVIENAEMYPIHGLFNFSDFFAEIDAYYYQTLGYERGVSTGWGCIDAFYRVVPGELTLVTGVPNSGKSEWIDALLCNINQNVGWKFALCSMENSVREHARKLLEKHVKKPFFNTSYGEGVERVSVGEFEEGKKWLNDTFHLIRCDKECLPNIKWVLDLAKSAVLRHGIRGLVIDPYNELDHQRGVALSETEYVSQMLTKVKRFAQHHSCHVWFVAHPRQLLNWNGRAPNLYDISGSAHFVNKCDNGIVVHRNRNAADGPIGRVEVHVLKVRNKVAGCSGDAFLRYNRATGEYFEAP